MVNKKYKKVANKMSDDSVNNNIYAWPALKESCLNDEMIKKPSSTVERGITGKADRVQVDYRLLAASSGFSAFNDIHVYLGADGQAINTLAWVNDNKKLRAVHIYPSRARDRTNRTGSMEKHLLEINAENLNRNCFLLYQLVLLNRVNNYKDELWWQFKDKNEWGNSDYSLKIAVDTPINDIEMRNAQSQLSAAVARINEFITKEALVHFYQKILSSEKLVAPQFIKGKKVSIDIFLCLFLPLNYKMFDHFSFLLDWPPNARFNHKKLTEVWDIIPNMSDYSAIEPSIKSSDSYQQAETYARALINNKPDLIKNIINNENSGCEFKQEPIRASSSTTKEPEKNVDILSDNLIDKLSDLSLPNRYSLDIPKLTTDNHKIIIFLLEYIISSKDVLDIMRYDIVINNESLILNDSDIGVIDFCNELVKKMQEDYNNDKLHFSQVVKMESIQALCFYLSLLYEYEQKDQKIDNYRHWFLINEKKIIPPFLFFTKLLPLDKGNNHSAFLNEKIGDFFGNDELLIKPFAMSLGEKVPTHYKEKVKKYFQQFFSSKTSCAIIVEKFLTDKKLLTEDGRWLL